MSLRAKQTNQHFTRQREGVPDAHLGQSNLNLAVWAAWLRQDGTTISTSNPGVWKQAEREGGK